MAELKAIVSDDHAAFRLGVATILKKECGVTDVVEASSFDEAIELLEATPGISLAVFDLSMPGMASAATLRGVREQFPGMVCVVLTGSNIRRDILIALDAGVHGFILKTMPLSEIAAAIRYVLGGDIYVPRDLAELGGPSNADFGAGAPHVDKTSQAIDRLSPRQREILNIMAGGGKTNKEIARVLNLTENTVKVHVNAIFRTLDIRDRDQVRHLIKDAPGNAAVARDAAGRERSIAET